MFVCWSSVTRLPFPPEEEDWGDEAYGWKVKKESDEMKHMVED